MSYLLDTHIALWLVRNGPELAVEAWRLISHADAVQAPTWLADVAP